jgi:hypothetical protein
MKGRECRVSREGEKPDVEPVPTPCFQDEVSWWRQGDGKRQENKKAIRMGENSEAPLGSPAHQVSGSASFSQQPTKGSEWAKTAQRVEGSGKTPCQNFMENCDGPHRCNGVQLFGYSVSPRGPQVRGLVPAWCSWEVVEAFRR